MNRDETRQIGVLTRSRLDLFYSESCCFGGNVVRLLSMLTLML